MSDNNNFDWACVAARNIVAELVPTSSAQEYNNAYEFARDAILQSFASVPKDERSFAAKRYDELTDNGKRDLPW